jgi:hypothetical protein
MVLSRYIADFISQPYHFLEVSFPKSVYTRVLCTNLSTLEYRVHKAPHQKPGKRPCMYYAVTASHADTRGLAVVEERGYIYRRTTPLCYCVSKYVSK